jgi:unspecific monooxygenase
VLSRDELGWPPPDPRQADFDRFEDNHLLSNEPPKHTRLRGLVGKAFTPRRVENLRERVAAIVDATLDELAERETFDVVHDFAEPLPVILICELLGVGAEHRANLRAWSAAIVKLYELDHTADQQLAANDAVIAFSAFVREVVAHRRAHPSDDLITALAEVEEGGETLTEDELIGTCILLLNAGHEATVNGTSGAILTFMRHRTEWERFCDAARTSPADPFLKTAVEELLRFDTPLPCFERWVLEDTELDGVMLERGTKVAMLYASANRDPRKFTAPDTLDLTRDPNPHVTFGLGIHFCRSPSRPSPAASPTCTSPTPPPPSTTAASSSGASPVSPSAQRRNGIAPCTHVRLPHCHPELVEGLRPTSDSRRCTGLRSSAVPRQARDDTGAATL